MEDSDSYTMFHQIGYSHTSNKNLSTQFKCFAYDKNYNQKTQQKEAFSIAVISMQEMYSSCI